MNGLDTLAECEDKLIEIAKKLEKSGLENFSVEVRDVSSTLNYFGIELCKGRIEW